jgi:hypothetical protein
MINTLAAEVPKLVIISKSFQNERLLGEINSHYSLVGEVADLRIYERNQPPGDNDGR